MSQDSLVSRLRNGPSFGVFAAGMVAGAGMAGLAFGVLAKDDSNDSANVKTEAKKESSRSSSEKRTSDRVDVDDLSPREAVVALDGLLAGGRVASSDEGFKHAAQLISKASRHDPQATLERAMAVEDPERRRDMLERVFNSWMENDQDAALTTLNGIENVALRRFLFRESVKALAYRDPEASVALLEQSKGLNDPELWGRAFANWVKVDLDAATVKILENEDPILRRSGIKEIAEQLAETDLGEALDWAEDLQNASDKKEAFREILYEAMQRDPQVALQHLDQIESEERRLDLAGRAAHEWAERDMDAALEWAVGLEEGSIRNHALGGVIGEVLHADPEAAEALASEHLTAEARQRVLGKIASARLGADVEGAIQWIEALPSEDRAAAWGSAAREWARHDPVAAAEFAIGSEDPDVQAKLVSAVSYSWPQIEPNAAAVWAAELPEATRGEAMTRIMDTWSRTHPEVAAEFVNNSLDGELREQMTRRVVNRWLYSDPSEAADWATTLEEDRAKTLAFKDIAGQWMRRDSMEASQWIATLPPSPSRDSAVYALIYNIEREDPETAALWAATLADPKMRDQATERIERRLRSRG